MPRKNRNARKGGNAHHQANKGRTTAKAPMSQFHGHAFKRRTDAWIKGKR